MDPKICKKTQDTLGKLIKKPPLTEKLLNKPPFRFLHDIMTSVIKTTGFMQGLFKDTEMNSENVKDKDSKIAFLQKALDMVVAVTGKSLSVKPVKIVAGHEPEKTNEFLQALAEAVNKNVDNDEYVKKVLGGGGGKSSGKEERREKDKERTKSADRRKSQDGEGKKEREKEGDKEKDDREKRSDRERDKHKERDRNRDIKTREKSRDGREERQRDRSKKRDQSREKENESPSRVNGEKEDTKEPPARLQRPSSAKGSRRRREAQNHAAGEDEEFQKEMAPSKDPMIGDDDLPPQVSAARQLARPSSARPAPPRPKQEASESEPAMRLGGQPANLIVDDGNEEDEDDDNFLVEESAPPPSEPEPIATTKPTDEDDAEHGALVKKMLESKKDLEGGSQNQAAQAKKTEIERPIMSDAQRRKQREMVQKEIDKLRASIQSLTRSANPLGKVMDYVQEDLDSMQQELDKWKTENAQHAMDLKKEMTVTDRAVEPLKQQLTNLERAISDQLDQIAATKCNIIKNDQKIEKMLRGITSS